MIRTYSDLIQIPTFVERYNFLRLSSSVGEETFGSERFLNQQFYRSTEWKRVRAQVIARDYGLDLACEDHFIGGVIHVHHMNPITPEQIYDGDMSILDPELLISVSLNTHNAIHFGDETLLPTPFVERSRGDTKLW